MNKNGSWIWIDALSIDSHARLSIWCGIVKTLKLWILRSVELKHLHKSLLALIYCYPKTFGHNTFFDEHELHQNTNHWKIGIERACHFGELWMWKCVENDVQTFSIEMCVRNWKWSHKIRSKKKKKNETCCVFIIKNQKSNTRT